ncbi:MAG: substrate-binding periplasmic protein [Acidobacteriota bacterium]
MRVTTILLLAVLLAVSNASALTIVTEDSPPSTIVRGDTVTGVSVEIVREIQRRIGDSTHIDVLPWARAYFMASTTPGVVLFATTRTPERESRFIWVGPILRLQWAFFAMSGKMKPLTSLDEAKRVSSIGTYKDDAREQFLKSQGFTNLESSSSPHTNFKKLKAGRIDLMVSTNLGVGAILPLWGMKPGDVENVYTFKEAELYIAFSNGSDEAVVAAWEKAFEDMRNDGTLAAIQDRWLPCEAAASEQTRTPTDAHSSRRSLRPGPDSRPGLPAHP